MLKPNNEIYLKCEYQLKQKTISRVAKKLYNFDKMHSLKNGFEISKP